MKIGKQIHAKSSTIAKSIRDLRDGICQVLCSRYGRFQMNLPIQFPSETQVDLILHSLPVFSLKDETAGGQGRQRQIKRGRA